MEQHSGIDSCTFFYNILLLIATSVVHFKLYRTKSECTYILLKNHERKKGSTSDTLRGNVATQTYRSVLSPQRKRLDRRVLNLLSERCRHHMQLELYIIAGGSGTVLHTPQPVMLPCRPARKICPKCRQIFFFFPALTQCWMSCALCNAQQSVVGGTDRASAMMLFDAPY